MEFTPFLLANFKGGLNTRSIPSELDDTELADVLNMEFDRNQNLATRAGTSVVYTDPASFTTRITSIYGFLISDGTYKIVVTTGSELYKDAGAGVLSTIKGALGLPTDKYWQWRAMNGWAIGVNGTIPVRWDGVTANAEALAGSPPQTVKYIETWNRRCWLSGDTTTAKRNILYYSKLGDPNDWTDPSSGSIEIDKDDGDQITGIYAHRETLYIFKRNRIHRLVTGGAGRVNTDPNGWKVELVASNIGCISAYTIQSVLDDLFFLSDYGVMSLRAVQEFGDVKQALMSANIKELSDLNRTIDTFASVVHAEKSQYWLGVPSTNTKTTNDIVYVLDYSDPQSLKWTRFDGLIAGAVFAIIQVSGKKKLYVGGRADPVKIYKLEPLIYTDANGLGYNKILLTKVFDFGDTFVTKLFNRIGVAIRLLSSSLALNVKYRFDEDDAKAMTIQFPIVGPVGAKWDIDKFDTSYFATVVAEDREVWRRIQNSPPGRRGQSIQIKVTNSNKDEGYILKRIKLTVEQLNDMRTTDV
jgi:hypothetical protein